MYDAQKKALVGHLAETMTKGELHNVWQALNYGKPVAERRGISTDGVSDVIEAIEEAAGGVEALLSMEGGRFRQATEAEATGHVLDREFESELNDDPEFLAALHHEEEDE